MIDRLRRCSDEGASAVEYGLLIAAIAGIIIAIVFGIGLVVKDNYTKTSSCLSAGAASTC